MRNVLTFLMLFFLFNAFISATPCYCLQHRKVIEISEPKAPTAIEEEVMIQPLDIFAFRF
jgi:hypothetical protein